MRLVLTNATLIDCVDPNPGAGASVAVEDGRIVEITNGRRSPSSQRAQVIDLGGAYLLPGLWDVHIHPDYATDPNITVAQQTARFAHGRGRGRRRPVRRSGSLHGRCLAEHVRLGRPGGTARLRLRKFPHHHQRTLPDLWARLRVRRPLRFRQRGEGTNQERRRPHQAEPFRRDNGSLLGPPHPHFPAGRGVGRHLRPLSQARLPTR